MPGGLLSKAARGGEGDRAASLRCAEVSPSPAARPRRPMTGAAGMEGAAHRAAAHRSAAARTRRAHTPRRGGFSWLRSSNPGSASVSRRGTAAVWCWTTTRGPGTRPGSSPAWTGSPRSPPSTSPPTPPRPPVRAAGPVQKAIRRSDTGAVLAVSSETYEVISHTQMGELVEAILEQPKAAASSRSGTPATSPTASPTPKRPWPGCAPSPVSGSTWPGSCPSSPSTSGGSTTSCPSSAPSPAGDIVSQRVRDNIDRARAIFRSLYLDSPTTQGVRGSAYGLVQAAGEYLDHVRGYRSHDSSLGRTLLRPEPLKAKAVAIAGPRWRAWSRTPLRLLSCLAGLSGRRGGGGSRPAGSAGRGSLPRPAGVSSGRLDPLARLLAR